MVEQTAVHRPIFSCCAPSLLHILLNISRWPPVYHLRKLTPKAKCNYAYGYTKLAGWLSAVQKEDTMASWILLCIRLVYMSASRNGVTFWAPKGSVNSLRNQNSLQSAAQLSYLWQKMITRCMWQCLLHNSSINGAKVISSGTFRQPSMQCLVCEVMLLEYMGLPFLE